MYGLSIISRLFCNGTALCMYSPVGYTALGLNNCIVLYRIISYRTALYCTVLCYTVLHCIALSCLASCRIVS